MKTKSTCTKCGKGFDRETRSLWGANEGGKRRQFCSKECSASYWRGVLNAKRYRPILARACAWCAKDFTPKLRRAAKFCSHQCSDKAKWQREHPPVERKLVCQSCSGEFSALGGARRKFCSPKCYRRYWTKQWRATHPGWRKKHDRKNKWGGTWIAALERDNFSCQVCGRVGSSEDLNGLIVHHLDGEGETRGKNHALENLQTLCGPCHGEVHHSLMLIRKEGKLFVKVGGKYLEVSEKPREKGE